MSKDELSQPLSPSNEQIASSDRRDEKVEESATYDPSEYVEEPVAQSATVEDHPQPQTAGDSYLDDDDLLTASSDEVLHQDEDTVIVQQDEAVVSWDIRGLYDETGKVRSKRSLRDNRRLC